MNKHDTVIGYIEYLDCNGCVRERIPYVDAEKFKTRIYASLYCGEPIIPVLFPENLSQPLLFEKGTIFPWGLRRKKYELLPYEIYQTNNREIAFLRYDYTKDHINAASYKLVYRGQMECWQQQIEDAFKDWIWKDPTRRQMLVKEYNERFNSLRPREYDGSHILFHGMSPEITLRPHQKNAIAHILYGGNTLLAHVVGAGKTYEMVAAAMEKKRLGLCSKTLICVPNHLTEQLAGEALQLYPNANILVARKTDFEKANRKRFCAKIVTGNYDIIVIGHSQFERIPLSQDRQVEYLQSQIHDVINQVAQLKEERAENFTVKQMERMRKQLEKKLDKLNDQSRKDDVVTFEQLGVDSLMVDEAHAFKNLAVLSKMRNVAGISQTESQRASDLYMKCRYLDEITGSRGVVFATGTPISNSMAELFTMQRYLQRETLEQHRLSSFDAWASTFGETVTAVELAPEGTGYRTKTRFSKFYNLPELMSMFKQVADVQTADMLNLPVPKLVGGKPINVALPPSPQQKQMVADLADRAEEIRAGNVDPTEDNMLKVTNDGRKLALDQRLIDPNLPENPNDKVHACAENVYRIWNDTKEKRLTQLVFCDLSTPKPDGFNVYDDLRNLLISMGIPENEVQFIHSANTEVKKAELFAKVRSGDVRVLMGSTGKMGAVFNLYTADDIYDADGSLVFAAGELVATSPETNADGYTYFTCDIPIRGEQYGSSTHKDAVTNSGKYIVKELRAPLGYYVNEEPLKVTFTYDGQAVQVLESTCTDKPTEMWVSKRDLTNDEELPGATLSIKDTDGNVVTSWVSTDTPHRVMGLHLGDTYTLTETRPADGYALADEITFRLLQKVDENGSNLQEAEVYYLTTKNFLFWTWDDWKLLDDATVIMRDDTIKAEFSKKDLTTMEELPGAELTITDKDGKEIERWVSTDKPHYIEKLPAGDYTLTEVKAPDGYAFAESVPFTVLPTGEVQQFEMLDDVIKVEISKKDLTTMEELPGAELTITDKDGKEIERWVSTDKPHYIEKLPAGDYTLTEVKAPDGYAFAESVPFTVLPTGEVQKFEMRDDVIKVEISKVDITTNKELPGAELTITNKDGKVMERWVSTDKPHYIEKLPAGDYTLTEITAPDGYEIAEDISFTVLPNGDVQRVVMKDAPIPEQPVQPTPPSTPTPTPLIPQTGDTFPLGLLLALASLSLAGLAALLYKSVHCKAAAQKDDDETE